MKSLTKTMGRWVLVPLVLVGVTAIIGLQAAPAPTPTPTPQGPTVLNPYTLQPVAYGTWAARPGSSTGASNPSGGGWKGPTGGTTPAPLVDLGLPMGLPAASPSAP